MVPGPEPSARCRAMAEAIGKALGRRSWVAGRASGWRIYCRYRGGLLDETVDALNRAVGSAVSGNRCSGNRGTIKLTLRVGLSADEEV